MTPRTAQIACVFAAIFLTSNAVADECRLARLASLDFDGRGAVMIPVSVEGKTATMVADTGSVASGIDPAVATRLAIPERRIMEGVFYSLAGPSFTYLATPHDFGLGDMHSSQELLLVWPTPMSEDGSVAGVVAADLLRHYDVDIDFGSHKFNLFSQDHCPGKVVYWTSANVAVVPVHVNNSGHVIVPVTIDDHPFDAMLDTGSSATFLNQKAARASFGLGPSSPGMIKVGDHDGPGGVPLYRYTFKNLSLEGLTIGNPTIDIFENQEETQATLQHHTGSRFSSLGGEEYELTLGVNELRHLHVYIAYKEQKLYISPASVAVGSTPPAGEGPKTATTPTPPATAGAAASQ